jgi:hypothetical protein
LPSPKAQAPKRAALPNPVLAASKHVSHAETEDEEEKEESKESEDDPLQETVIPSPKVLAKKSSHVEVPKASATEEAENNEIKQLPQTEQAQTLQKLRSALETKIQSEINQLNRVVEMQDGGKGHGHFDYELVKVVKDQEESKQEHPAEAKKASGDSEE